MKIYITGATNNDVESKEELEIAMRLLEKKGCDHFSALNGFDSEALLTSDGILLLGGWTANNEAIEAAISAEEHCIKKFYGIEQIGKISND